MKVLVWLIPILPALAVLVNGLLGRLSFVIKPISWRVGAVGLSFLFSLLVILRTLLFPAAAHPRQTL